MTLILIILGLALFIGLIVVHEFGHFIVARRNGVTVEEFGVFFPPRVFQRRTKAGYIFSINLLPIGGFVKLKGEHDADKSEGSFGIASLWVKAKIMLAGVAFNLITALVLLTIVAAFGMPVIINKHSIINENQFTVRADTKIIKEVENKDVVKIGEVVAGSPAEQIGLRPDDRIVAINERPIDYPDTLLAATELYKGQTVVLTIDRNGEILRPEVKLNEGSPHLGVAPYSAETGILFRRSTWSSPIVALGLTAQFTRLTFKALGTALVGLGRIISGSLTNNVEVRRTGQTEASSQVSGPLGIYFVLKASAEQGLVFILFIIALISLTLAIMNILPIPALDGGRFYMILLSRKIWHRPLTRKIEERVVGASFGFLMVLFVLITIVDAKRFF